MPLVYALSYALFRAVERLVRWLPERSLPALAARAGVLFRLLAPRRVAIAERNLALAFGDELDEAGRRELARRSIDQFLLSTLELMRLWDYAARVDNVVTGVDEHYFEQARSTGKGILVLTAHYGLWDIGGGYLARRGCPLHAVARAMDHPQLNDYIIRLRERLGMVTIPQRNAMVDTLKCLHRGGAVAILADQHASKQKVTVPFFGYPADTVYSVSRLAQQTGAVVLPVALQRTAPMRHEFKFYPPLQLAHTGDRERDLVTNTTLMNQAYETMIRERPDHWYWFHRRWKAWERQQRDAARAVQETTTT